MQKKPSTTESIICVATRLENIANKFVFFPMGLSSTSVKILGILGTGKQLTPSQILEIVGGTKSNVSQRLNHLEKAGFIERVYAKYAADKRKVAVVITKSGKQKLKEAMARVSKASISFEKQFSKAELAAHHAFFQKIQTILDGCEERVMKKLFPLNK